MPPRKPITYILECNDGTLYTGWTVDIVRRLAAHSGKRGAKYTRSRLPVTLVYVEECNDRSAAMRREAAIKKLARQDKLNLVHNYQTRKKRT